jgi:hypothetical protein
MTTKTRNLVSVCTIGISNIMVVANKLDDMPPHRGLDVIYQLWGNQTAAFLGMAWRTDDRAIPRCIDCRTKRLGYVMEEGSPSKRRSGI